MLKLPPKHREGSTRLIEPQSVIASGKNEVGAHSSIKRIERPHTVVLERDAATPYAALRMPAAGVREGELPWTRPVDLAPPDRHP